MAENSQRGGLEAIVKHPPGGLRDGIADALRSRVPRRADRPDFRQAAVLLPLYQSETGPHLILTKRTEEVPTHKGQIAFPGGGFEEGDADLLTTAIRETLRAPKPPAVKEDCEYCRFAAGRSGPTAPALGATPGVEGRFSNFASSMARSGEVWRHDTMSNPATRPASGTLRILRRRGARGAEAAPCTCRIRVACGRLSQ